jgi:hypothetical protein
LSSWLPHFLDNKQANNLALYPSCHNDGTRLRKRLRPRRDVRRIAEDLAARIEHRRASVDGDPCSQFGPARAFVPAV